MSYLTEEEQKMSNDDRILQLALGLQTCKTIKDAMELLVEAQELAVKAYEQKVKEAINKLRNMRCTGKCDLAQGLQVECCDDISAQSLLEELGL